MSRRTPLLWVFVCSAWLPVLPTRSNTAINNWRSWRMFGDKKSAKIWRQWQENDVTKFKLIDYIYIVCLQDRSSWWLIINIREISPVWRLIWRHWRMPNLRHSLKYSPNIPKVVTKRCPLLQNVLRAHRTFSERLSEGNFQTVTTIWELEISLVETNWTWRAVGEYLATIWRLFVEHLVIIFRWMFDEYSLNNMRHLLTKQFIRRQ